MSNTNSVQALIDNVVQYQYNPAAIQRGVMGIYSDISNGEIEIVDPTNPFLLCLETSACNTAGFMIKDEILNRYQYPYSAQQAEELYPHMSDKDFVDRFASPAKTVFMVLLPLEETLNKMVADGVTSMRKLVIPRNTFFTVANTQFSLEYPVEIRQLAHGGLQVVYDASIASPLQTLETNYIPHEIQKSAEGDWIAFALEVQQFSVISQYGSVNAATDFKVNIALDDQYYYTRVYAQDAAGKWNEIRTTHTEQIYDPNTPTAVLKVVDKKVTVIVPQIYTSTQQLKAGLRIDVYQTKGPLEMILWEYPFSAFGVTWKAYDKNDETEFTAPLKTFRSLIVFSDKAVTGGSNALSFEELRKRVIQNAMGEQHLPITNVQIETSLEQQGYAVMKNIDNITNRVFLATKSMPAPADPSLITAAAASIEMVAFSIKNAVLLRSIIDNGESVTITPNTLYKIADGMVELVPDEEVDRLLAMPAEMRALIATNGDYLYTPFHYVLDMSGKEFEARAYYLDDPEISTKLFVSENDTTMIQVGTGVYGILRTSTGYVIQVVTQSGDAYKALPDDEVFVQLAFIPAGEKDRAYLNGVLVGKTEANERIYNFDLSSNFDIDSTHNLALTQFLLYSTEPRSTRAGLMTEFDIIYSTSAVMSGTWSPNRIDDTLGRFLLPQRIAGITQEVLRVRFGYALKSLWTRARSVISSVEYKKWEVDIPKRYQENVYERDANGSAIKFDENGHPIVNLLRKKGDLVLDAENEQVYEHRKGDVMYDDNGNPIPLDPRGMIRQVDIMLIEGVYWFATDLSAIAYRSSMTQTVVSWLMNDLAKISGRLLDQTRLYFHPKTTLGIIRVMVENGLIKSIPANQAFVVDLYVSKQVNGNAELKGRLEKTTIKMLNEALKSAVVTVDGILTQLRAQYGNDVISVKLTGLGGNLNLQALTIIDESNRCSLRKRLASQADGGLIVEEDVTCNFIVHEAETS